MRRYDLGSAVSLRHLVKDADGNPAAATVGFTVVHPDATTATPPVGTTTLGVYDVTVADVDQYGVYTYAWAMTGAVENVVRGQFYVAGEDAQLPPLASLDRLGDKLGYVPEGSEADRADEALAAASELIRDVAGKTWVDEATGALQAVPRRVVQICVAAAYRSFGNPEGLTQRTIGDSSKAYDRAGREGGEDVYLTKAEEDSIRKAAGGSALQVVTLVSPYNGTYLDDAGDLVWA